MGQVYAGLEPATREDQGVESKSHVLTTTLIDQSCCDVWQLLVDDYG